MVQKARPGSPSDLEDKRARALTDAALSAAKRLGLGSTDLASILGVAEGAVAAMRKGERAVDGVNGEAERADALVKIVARLSTLLGAEETKWRSWIRGVNATFDAKPIDLMKQRDGAARVRDYLANASSL